MFISDIPSILSFWFTFFLMGIIFLPLTLLIFSSYLDRGYIFSKILAILLLSYTIWLLASLKILSFTSLNIILLLGLFLMINLYSARKFKFISIFKSHWKIFLFEEFLFLAGLIFWSFIRAYEPSIHGLEKFMDFGFINSILRSEYFPPKDLWLTPETINYYYFGHLTVAVLTKLSFLNPTVTYNLMLAAIFGLTLSTSFSIGTSLYSFFSKNTSAIFLAGVLSTFLVTLAGNLQTIYAFFKNYPNPDLPVPFWQLEPMLNFSGYWYPNATRFIPNTIHEFPIYSFVVSDLHGHVLNIPFVFLMIGFLIKLYYQTKIHFRDYLLISGLLGVFLMTNVLDGPIYLILIVLLLFFKQAKFSLNSIISASKQIFLIIIFMLFFSLPFWLAFKPFSSGIGVLCSPNFLTQIGRFGPLIFEADHCARSPFWMLLILYGFFYFIFLTYLFKVLKLRIPNMLKKIPMLSPTDRLILIFTLFATVAIIIPEIVYVKDIYPGHYRANTVFKFGYQAFIILAIVSGYAITRLIRIKPPILYRLLSVFLFCLIAIYPYFAINSYYNGLKNYQGLDGLSYLETLYPSDYRAILWLKENIQGQPVILEAQGDSYTDYARVSSNTGLPTVIGWPVHEWLWRGSPEDGSKRSDEVTLLYEDQDLEQTKELIKKYNISLIFIGSLERQKYINLNEDKFISLGKVIFRDNQTVVYQLN
ncbi:hypothetical protein HYT18_02755 [Candidatus Microgenomates bacterium]|nr:hypothetical protein [Candidatus Microgenomates bacterium]